MNTKKIITALLCGMLGCVFMCAGDWLMLYGDPTYNGSLYWLTNGAADIPAWRNALSMAVAFPAVVLYAFGLFAIGCFLQSERRQQTYHYLTVFGLTPWLCLHLFIAATLYVFAWLQNSVWADAAFAVAEALRNQYVWIVYLSYLLMLPPYFYLAWQMFQGRSVFPRTMALSNPLIIYLLLKTLTLLMPVSAFRIGFTNGLMSESMFLWFLTILVWTMNAAKKDKRKKGSA